MARNAGDVSFSTIALLANLQRGDVPPASADDARRGLQKLTTLQQRCAAPPPARSAAAAAGAAAAVPSPPSLWATYDGNVPDLRTRAISMTPHQGRSVFASLVGAARAESDREAADPIGDGRAFWRSTAGVTMGTGRLEWMSLQHVLLSASITEYLFLPLWILLMFPVNPIMWAKHGSDAAPSRDEASAGRHFSEGASSCPTMLALERRLFPIFAECSGWCSGKKLVILVADALPRFGHPYLLREAQKTSTKIPDSVINSTKDLCAIFGAPFDCAMAVFVMTVIGFTKITT